MLEDKLIIEELKQARFWDADGNRKWAIFDHFQFTLDNHIHIAKYLVSIRDK